MIKKFWGKVKTGVTGFGGFWALEKTLDAIIKMANDFIIWSNLSEHAETLLFIFMIAVCVFFIGVLGRFTGLKGSSNLVVSALLIGSIFMLKSLDNSIFKTIYAAIYQKVSYVINTASTDAVASTLFWMFCSIVGFVVFFGTVSNLLGIKKEAAGAAKMIYWSLPVSFFLMFFYIAVKVNQQSQDPLYAVITTESVQSANDWQLVKAARNIRHNQLLRQNKDYVTNLVKSRHSEWLYADVAQDIGKNGILTKNANGEDAILVAVKTGNKAAVKAFIPFVSKSRKYRYGTFFNKENLTLFKIAKRERHEQLYDLLT